MTPHWVAIADSRIGSAHVRDGSPTQDSHQTWADDRAAVVAVADGHGYHAHFRSAIGSRLATAAATDVLTAAVASFHDREEVERQLVDVLGPALVDAWATRVLDHVDQYPFTPLEHDLLGTSPVVDKLRPYGSTVIAMAASRDVLAILQIGDGEAVVALGNGQVFRPLPVDPDLDGARTSSLCQPDPLRSLRCASLDVSAEDIALGFICTDGFGSSRVVESWWKQAGEELLHHARTRGFSWIASKMPLWLDEPARLGGDDATLAVLCGTRHFDEREPPSAPLMGTAIPSPAIDSSWWSDVQPP